MSSAGISRVSVTSSPVGFSSFLHVRAGINTQESHLHVWTQYLLILIYITASQAMSSN